MKILIIIPAFNEEKNLSSVISQINKSNIKVNYLIVNDCSTDDTVQICEKNNYNYISLPVGLGIGGGVQSGYKYALKYNYDIAIQMDGDGQHDAAYIRNLVQPIINNSADIVIGSRLITGDGFQPTKLRRFGINFLSRLIKLCCGADIKDVTSGFRAVNKKFIQIYANEYSTDYPEPEAIITSTFYDGRILEIPVIMHERHSGKSSINFWKSIYYMIKVSIAIILYRVTFNKGGFRK